jgi:uncharacterized protein (DUF433 family)
MARNRERPMRDEDSRVFLRTSNASPTSLSVSLHSDQNAAHQRRWDRQLRDILQIAAERSDWITMNPKVQGGSPVVRGTRIPAYMVLRAVEQHGVEGAVRSYPDLNIEQVKAVLYFARVVLESPVDPAAASD